jgi:hypothetical protein
MYLGRMEVRSWQGSAAYVAVRVSTEPFNDVAPDEPADKAVKQAWDMHGFVKTDKPKAQVFACANLQSVVEYA